MPPQKKTTQPDTQRILTIDLHKAFAILASAIIGSSVTTILALGSTWVRDHFLIANLSTAVDAIEEKKVDRAEFAEIKNDVLEIKTDIKEIRNVVIDKVSSKRQ